MNYILVTFPIAVICFFLGFYLQLVIKILVDTLNYSQKFVIKQEQIVQQEQLNKGVRTTFVEPQSLAEIQADEDLQRIRDLNAPM